MPSEQVLFDAGDAVDQLLKSLRVRDATIGKKIDATLTQFRDPYLPGEANNSAHCIENFSAGFALQTSPNWRSCAAKRRGLDSKYFGRRPGRPGCVISSRRAEHRKFACFSCRTRGTASQRRFIAEGPKVIIPGRGTARYKFHVRLPRTSPESEEQHDSTVIPDAGVIRLQLSYMDDSGDEKTISRCYKFVRDERKTCVRQEIDPCPAP